MLYKYLNFYTIKQNIINVNPFKERYNNNNDLCVHVRLTDATIYNPGINYYLKTIKNINFDNLFICSDDINHDIIKQIIQHYPNGKIIDYDEVQTIQFASTCKNIVLSNGTFSSMIGYLSFFSTINYPTIEQGKEWHGDLFSIDGWIEHSL